MIFEHLYKTDKETLRQTLFYLSEDPLPCRCLNVTLPGHEKCTLYEADDVITARLRKYGYSVRKAAVHVQAFVLDRSVKDFPGRQAPFRKPKPDEPWYKAFNIIADKAGTDPEKVIVIVSHKDSQSWLGCAAGAHDNAAGTAVSLELARVLSSYEPEKTIRFLFCNEEHWPWTSVQAAEEMARSGEEITAVINIDSPGGKSAEDRDNNIMTNVTRYSTEEGERLADLMAYLNNRYSIGLKQSKVFSEPNDDDGSFVKAGIRNAVLNIGSYPYAEPNYHTQADTPDTVDIDNILRAAKLNCAAAIHLDTNSLKRTSHDT